MNFFMLNVNIAKLVGGANMMNKIETGKEILSTMIARDPQRQRRTIKRIIREEETAEDLAQESLIRALYGIASLRGNLEEPLLCSWLDRIARNLALNYIRDKNRKPDFMSLNNDSKGNYTLLDSLPSSSPAPDQECSQIETGKLLHQLIQSLPAELRAVFLLRKMENLSTIETSDLLNISEGLVKWRLHQAKKLLREMLAEKDIDQN